MPRKSIEGSDWQLVTVGGAPAVAGKEATMAVSGGRVTGSGGCNRYRGTAEFDASSIAFKPLAGTKMACEAAVMEQEARFHQAVEQAKAWRIDAATRKLSLLNDGGTVLIRFAPME